MLKTSWPGKNGFWCKGKYLKGADWYKSVFTGSLISVSLFSLEYFSCSYYLSKGEYIPSILIAGLTLLSYIFLFISATHDPGYIPKQVVPFTTHYAQNLNEHISSTKQLSFIMRGCLIKLKFCSTCMVYRPPRCSHCSICNLCVEGFDHHCPWIGNCIGKRNYFYFIGFVISVSLLCTSSLIICINHIYTNRSSIGFEVIFSIINSVVAVIVIAFVFCLLGFHWFLLAAGLTTNEKIKNIWGKQIVNPFNTGSIKFNFLAKIKEFRSKSQFNINAKVSVYDEEINPNELHRGCVVSKVCTSFFQTHEENANTVIVKKEDIEKIDKIDKLNSN